MGRIRTIGAAALVLGLAAGAASGELVTLFDNGGFETGTLGGWTASGNVGVVGHALDPYTFFTQDRVFDRTFAAQVGNAVAAGGAGLSPSGEALVSTLSQTAIVAEGLDLAYLAWSYAGVHPAAGLEPDDEPFFHLVVRNLTSGEILVDVAYRRGDVDDPASGLVTGPVQPEQSADPLDSPYTLAGTWIYKPWTALALTFSPEDYGAEILLELTVRDSAGGAYPSYARFDEVVRDTGPQGPPAAVIAEPRSAALLACVVPVALLVSRRRRPERRPPA